MYDKVSENNTLYSFSVGGGDFALIRKLIEDNREKDVMLPHTHIHFFLFFLQYVLWLCVSVCDVHSLCRHQRKDIHRGK